MKLFNSHSICLRQRVTQTLNQPYGIKNNCNKWNFNFSSSRPLQNLDLNYSELFRGLLDCVFQISLLLHKKTEFTFPSVIMVLKITALPPPCLTVGLMFLWWTACVNFTADLIHPFQKKPCFGYIQSTECYVIRCVTVVCALQLSHRGFWNQCLSHCEIMNSVPNHVNALWEDCGRGRVHHCSKLSLLVDNGSHHGPMVV